MFCEGRTEASFLGELKQELRLSSVKIHERCGEPKALMGKAVEAARTGIEVWAVFDRDDHPHWKAAIDRAAATGVHLAISNPCFEIWALLLHEDQNAEIHRRRAQSRLKKIHKGYCHNKHAYLDFDSAYPALDAAHERCERINAVAQRDRESEYANPSSTFHLLVERMRELARDS